VSIRVFNKSGIVAIRQEYLFKKLVFFMLIASFFMSESAFSMNDPMQPPEYSVSSGVVEEMMDSKLKLQMILMSPERKFAVLNNKTVKEGEMIAGAKIISIEKEHVVVKRKGKVFDLRLDPTKNRGGIVR